MQLPCAYTLARVVGLIGKLVPFHLDELRTRSTNGAEPFQFKLHYAVGLSVNKQ
jgi:hypothetical protein